MVQVGRGLAARAPLRVMDGLHFTERALNAGDDVPDVLPFLPDLGKNFIERRPFRAPIADHAGPYGKWRASPASAYGRLSRRGRVRRSEPIRRSGLLAGPAARESRYLDPRRQRLQFAPHGVVGDGVHPRETRN